MAVIGACAVPHPPLIIPSVGRGEQKKIQKTVDAYKAAAREIARCAPQTIIVVSPHAPMYADYFHISPGSGASGSFGRFGAGDVRCAVNYDEEFVDSLSLLCAEELVPAGKKGEKDPQLDHASLVPLYFINQVYTSYKAVRIGLSGLNYAVHFELGSLIAQTAENLGRRVYIVASGDLSHKLKDDGPYGFAPEGPRYDSMVMDVLERCAFDELVSFDEGFCEKAAECGHRSFVIMAGAVHTALADAGNVRTKAEESVVRAGAGVHAVRSANVSYEGPFGVGYGVCSIVFETEDGAHGTDGLHAEKTVSFSQAEVNNDRCPYTALARKAVESYVSDGTVIDVSDALMDGLASEMTERKAGVFVSLKIGGQLRGCIGTIAPTQSSIAEEIIANGISAAVRDPRFPPVSLSELPELTYSVDVLGESEQVHSLSMLDIKRYGVIISSGVKRGLLLPDLDGVDSVEEQIDIAMRKGGIQKDDDISVQRFEVVRFREQRK